MADDTGAPSGTQTKIVADFVGDTKHHFTVSARSYDVEGHPPRIGWLTVAGTCAALTRGDARRVRDALTVILDAAGPEPITLPDGCTTVLDVDGDVWRLNSQKQDLWTIVGRQLRPQSLADLVRLYGPVRPVTLGEPVGA